MGRKFVNSISFTAEDLKQSDFDFSNRLRPAERLENDELKIWDRVAPLLSIHGYLNDLFVDSLVEYCRVVVKIDALVVHLRRHGDTYESSTRNGFQIKGRPEVGQLNEARRMLRSYVGDFGLTPQAKRQLESAIQSDIFDEEDNEFEKIERTASAGHTLQ